MNPVYDCGPDDSMNFKVLDLEPIESPAGPPPREDNDRAADRKANTNCDPSPRSAADLPPGEEFDPERGAPVYDVLENPNEAGLDQKGATPPVENGRSDTFASPVYDVLEYPDEPGIDSTQPADNHVFLNPVYEESAPLRKPFGGNFQGIRPAEDSMIGAYDSPVYDNTEDYDAAGRAGGDRPARGRARAPPRPPPSDEVYENPVYDNTDEYETEANPLYSSAKEARNLLPGVEQRGAPKAYQGLCRVDPDSDGRNYQTLSRRETSS